MIARRTFLTSAAAGAAALATGALAQLAHAAASGTLLKRKIPSTGEMIPVIGMGTSGSFQVPPGSPEYEKLKEVLKVFFDGGATVIDTAPTYGNAEDNLGPLLTEGGHQKKAWIATKLSGVNGRAAGMATIGVAWGYHPRARLAAAGADALIESFDALDDALASLRASRP